MGTQADYRDKADHNQEFLDTIESDRFPDRAVTVCFYKALHLVEMLFAANQRHSDSHWARHDVLKRDYTSIWKAYRPLYAISRYARYRVRGITPATVAHVRNRLEAVSQLVDGQIQRDA
jgi:hypothetical protein